MTKKNKSGKFKKKRGDTKLGTIEKQYNIDFGKRSDMKLENYLKKEGYPSLSKALKRVTTTKSKKKS